METLHIAMCTPFPPNYWGGLGIAGYNFSKELGKLGHEVIVITTNWPTYQKAWKGEKEPRGVTVLRTDDNVQHYGRDIITDYLIRHYFMPGGKKTDVIREELFENLIIDDYIISMANCNFHGLDILHHQREKLDIIHTNDWIYALIGYKYNKETGVKWIHHTHLMDGTGGKPHQTRRFLEKTANSQCDRPITNSIYMAKKISKEFGIPSEDIGIVYNGIDTGEYNPKNIPKENIDEIRESYKLGEDPTLLFMGRLDGMKGPDKIVLAMPKILKEVNNAKLVILGIDGNQTQYIQKLIHEKGLYDSIRMNTSFVSEETKKGHILTSDIGVFPSEEEPFGIVNLECMAMERPVVSTIYGGPSEIITEDTGRLVDPHNIDELADNIIELLQDDTKRKKMGKNARKCVEENFSWESVTKNQLVEEYKKILEN